MRKELTDFEADEIVGGTVSLSASMGLVGFSRLREAYVIQGDYKEMRDLLFHLQDENENMPTEEFDKLVRDEYKNRGWI